MKRSRSKIPASEGAQLFSNGNLMLDKKRKPLSSVRADTSQPTKTRFENISGVDLSGIRARSPLNSMSLGHEEAFQLDEDRVSEEPHANDLAAPSDGTSLASPVPAPADGPSAPLDGPTNASVAGSFLATRYAFASPAFGKVAWNTHEPLATYSAWLDGSDWRFRLDTLSLRVPVGVAGGGKTDISGANSAEVKRTTWSTVESDLRPSGAAINRSPRTTYWAEDLTWIHEIFHFDEYNGFLKTTFTAFETEIEGPGYTESKQAGDTNVDALARKQPNLKTKLLAAWNKAKTDMSPDMEKRAYDDGAASYTARADAVKARATTEGW